MNTKTKNPPEGGAPSWLQNMADQKQGGDTVMGLLKYLVIAALVVAIGITAWQFIKKGDSDTKAEASDLIFSGIELLPSTPLRDFMTINKASLGTTAEGGAYYDQLAVPNAQRKSVVGPLTTPEDCKKYVDKVESVLATFDEKKDLLLASDQAWLYLHVRQQLLFFAARNSRDNNKKIAFLNEQMKLLDTLEKDHGDVIALKLKSDTRDPDSSGITLWRELARKELAFFEKHNLDAAITADQGLSATLKFANGQTLMFKFFSRVAPKTVAAFLENVKGGFYEGTAVHAINKIDNTISFGNPLSRLASGRKAIWNNTQGHYTVPNEQNALLPVKKGSVSFSGRGVNTDGFHFNVHMAAQEATSKRFTVFAEVTEGLDSLKEWFQTEVHDETGISNPDLPRVRLGLESVTVEGVIAFPSVDSWKPSPKLPEVPDETDQEKGFYEAIKEEAKTDAEPDTKDDQKKD
ncbi:MAG: peptidylprolyl isomerase [Planctomycetota bacterium]